MHTRTVLGGAAAVMIVVAATVVGVVAGSPAGAGGSTITIDVTTTADEVDPGALPGADLSLREAVIYVNAQDVVDNYIVRLAPSATYTLTLCGSPDNSPAVGDINVTVSPAFVFEGRGSTVRQTCGFSRVVQKPAAPGQLVLDDITLTGGNGALGGSGASSNADIRVQNGSVISGNSTPSAGAGLYTEADLFITDSTIEHNGGAYGGAVYGDDSVEITNSTIRSNSASSGGGVASGGPTLINRSTIEGNIGGSDGGGVHSAGPVTVQNSTITRNVAGYSQDPPGTQWQGGGIYSESTTTIVSSTLVANAAPTGANVSSAGTAFIGRSILALGSGGGDCDLIAGGNLPDTEGRDQSCAGIVPINTLSLHPMAAPLASNGGPTQTMRLVSPSRALDAYNDPCPDGNDQRGTARPVGPDCDAGAFEGAAQACTETFNDVSASSTFFDEICWLTQMGITGGFPDGGFHPAQDVSRQAMAAFLFRLAGSPIVYTFGDTFTDVDASSGFFEEIQWLGASGIAGGFPDGTFRPQQSVTRQAMSAFLYRVAGEPGFVLPGTPTFTDVPADHSFYDEIEWMADSGVSTGFGDGTFRPDDAVTRQAMAAFLLRLADTVPLAGL
jgi:hypothetical protein